MKHQMQTTTKEFLRNTCLFAFVVIGLLGVSAGAYLPIAHRENKKVKIIMLNMIDLFKTKYLGKKPRILEIIAPLIEQFSMEELWAPPEKTRRAAKVSVIISTLLKLPKIKAGIKAMEYAIILLITKRIAYESTAFCFLSISM